ncbi:cobyric acid synthase [Roseospirillum parvum]|uniref:Cobyric acid synthase n=1 Tax=Roseospirillum parvum TaxID=83401 RepID=A0A1G8BW54_9PROT|nr:cobyric acid synthase [Roseospirillum parvum]SDH37334.1 adenosylcobyric acid synthase [Roseospirillum parvum]
MIVPPDTSGLPTEVDQRPRRARVLMLQGTSSDVGKSLLVAGLCRAYANRGLKVLPFKAQNMSNNAALAVDSEAEPGPDGTIPPGEIGRAQALQARACRVAPSIDMNPVLLKPQTEIGAQVVLRGRVLGNCPAKVYHRMRHALMPSVLSSLNRLWAEADLVLVEGAGSGAEMYLRDSDITNMRLADSADLPVVFISDIDRGGTMGALVGSHALLRPNDRARVKGYLINKFRGDFSIFEPACETITEHTGWPFLGVLRWFEAAGSLPAEDSLALERPARNLSGRVRIAVPRLQRVANFDDLDPLAAEPAVDLFWLQPGQPLPADTDVVILPGSKATRADLAFLKAQGWDIDILAHVRRGGHVVGLCGGYQMMGHAVRDPQGLEGTPGETPGLGLLDLITEIGGDKRLIAVDMTDTLSGQTVRGFEMHMGCTEGPGLASPWFELEKNGQRVAEGAVAHQGRVMGGYVHGLFADDGFRAHWLKRVGATAELAYEERVEATLDALAVHCEQHLDLDKLYDLAK